MRSCPLSGPLKILMSVMVIWLASGCFPSSEPGTTVHIDGRNRHQTIEGFGASDAWRVQFVGANWPREKAERIADLLFSQEMDENGNPEGIGLSIWRFYLGAGTAEMGNSSGIVNEWRRAECFLDEKGNYDWTKQGGQQWFLRAARERGVECFLAFSIAPPVFWSKNGMGHSPEGDISMNIKSGYLDDYARYLADVLKHFRDEGLEFDYLSPFNEPQWSWHGNTQEGTTARNQDLFEFIGLLSAELYKRALGTELLIGEAATIRHLADTVDNDSRDNQVKVFFDPRSSLYIGDLPNVRHAISGHSYFTVWPIGEHVQTRKQLAARIRQTDPDLEYWQTEYCILERNGEIRGGRGRDLGMPTALFVARIIHNDLCIANAVSWQWWTALSQCDYKDGLIHLDDGKCRGMTDPRSALNDSLKYDGFVRETKLLWALGNYSRFVRPGMVRIHAQADRAGSLEEQSRDLMVSAFLDPDSDQAVVVLVNQANAEKNLNLRGNLLKGKRSPADLYLTSEESDLEHSTVSWDSFSIPSHSIATLVLDPETIEP